MMEICSNCEKILDDNDKIVRDGSDVVAHMYPQECIRWLRIYIGILVERIDNLESELSVRAIHKKP